MGQGYVGLPLSQLASLGGWTVRGFDVNPGVVTGLNNGVSHVDDISNDEISAMLDAGFVATADESVIGDADVIVICVPTPLSEDGSPELKYVKAAASSIGRFARPGVLVVLESTTYPGTTERELLPAILAEGRLSSDEISLAFSPERIDPGNKQFTLRNTPKIVGGRTEGETDLAEAFYSHFIDEVIRVKSPREAEMAKLVENTYRHVNIALMNELARFAHELDIDLWNVIDASATKPFGYQAFYPGPGVGGHCIPIDPNYLSYEVKRALGVPFRFVELAQEINGSMPSYVVSRAQNLLNDAGKALNGSRVLLLGVTYKANIADQRESPAQPLGQILLSKGAQVSFHDPYVSHWKVTDEQILDRQEDLQKALKEADLVIQVQAHREYSELDIAGLAKRVLDTRGKLEGTNVQTL